MALTVLHSRMDHEAGGLKGFPELHDSSFIDLAMDWEERLVRLGFPTFAGPLVVRGMGTGIVIEVEASDFGFQAGSIQPIQLWHCGQK